MRRQVSFPESPNDKYNKYSIKTDDNELGKYSTKIYIKGDNIKELTYHNIRRHSGPLCSDISWKIINLFRSIQTSEHHDKLKMNIKVKVDTYEHIKQNTKTIDTRRPPDQVTNETITNAETLLTWSLLNKRETMY